MQKANKIHLSVPRGSVVLDKDDVIQLAIERLDEVNSRPNFNLPCWVMEHLRDVLASTVERYADISVQMHSPYLLADNLLINCASYDSRMSLFGTNDIEEIKAKVREAEFKGEREVVFTDESDTDNILVIYLSHIDD